MKTSFIGAKLVLLCILLMTTKMLTGQDRLTQKLAAASIHRYGDGYLIGQTISDPNYHKTFNFSKEKIKLKDFRGKLIILDFWHQYCSTCLALLPKLSKLQQRFKDSILVMPVTFQSKSSIQNFFEKRTKQGNPITLPSIVEDTLLNQMFPHLGDPYDVWIDPNGQLIGLTSGDAINQNMIEDVLNKDYLRLKNESRDPTFDDNKPYLINGNGGDQMDFTYRSILTGNNYKLRQEWQNIRDSTHLRIFVSNYKAIFIFKDLLIEYSGLMNKYKDLEMDASNKLVIIPPDLKEKLNHKICYELILPASYDYKDGFLFMLNNLENYYKTNVSIQEQPLECLSLVKIKHHKIIDTAERKMMSRLKPNELMDLDVYITRLNNLAPIPYIINNTGYSGKISTKWSSWQYSNFSSLQLLFKENGFELVKKQIRLPVIVFKKN